MITNMWNSNKMVKLPITVNWGVGHGVWYIWSRCFCFVWILKRWARETFNSCWAKFKLLPVTRESYGRHVFHWCFFCNSHQSQECENYSKITFSKVNCDSSLLFSLLRTVAESFAHSIPAFFLVIPKRFPISFWQTKFYLNQNNFTKLENYYTSSHNHGSQKNGSLQ